MMMQNTSHSQLVRRGGPEVPEEADEEHNRLRGAIGETQRENEALRQVIAQNDSSARFAISQLQQAL